VIKVILTGSESSGKTELARELARHFGAPLSEEFVRDYAAARGGTLGFGDHGPIAKGQMAAEDAAIARAKDVVILDTDLVSTVVYCEHYFGSCPAWIAEEARRRAGDLYLLMKPDIPWVADGVRDRPQNRDEMHEFFRGKLVAFGARFVEIGGDRHGRFSAAVQAIEARQRATSGR
jgi:NadR type nicotinamide-nucleotide adenylyltransferase